MSQYNIIVSTAEATVVSEYEPQQTRSDAYQSEAALEAAFIKQLTEQGYTYLQIHSSDELVKNLREQLEKLNGYRFSDDEWQRFFNQNLANSNDGIVEKTRLIQEDNVQVLKRDDGSSKNITLIDKKNIHNNSLQVINQYVENGGNYDNRYDVTVLVNGFPLVHIELKRRGVALKEAFNQIERYQRDSFWAASGLYEYVQLFVISNGTHTKYYSNTTRISAIKERDGKKKVQKTSSSFEFTSFWADANNKVIPDLVDFTRTFFQKHTLLNIITKYIVFEMELVKQIEVNIDYILMLVAKYHKSNCEDKEILIAIDRAIKSSIELRSKKELIENFIATINTQTDVNSDWKRFVLKQKETDLSALIADEKLKDEETRKYMENAFRDGAVKTTGTDIDKLMPPVSRFGGGNRAAKKQGIIEKIQAFFEKYFGIV